MLDHVQPVLLPCLLSSLALANTAGCLISIKTSVQLRFFAGCHSALSTGLCMCGCVYIQLRKEYVCLSAQLRSGCVYKCGCVPFRLLTLHLSAE